MIINKTPHPIRLYSNLREDGLDDLTDFLIEAWGPEGDPVRLGMVELGKCDGVEMIEFGHAVNLPPKVDGTRYIVSLVSALALVSRRSDLLVPYREVRNSQGVVIGCRALAQPV